MWLDLARIFTRLSSDPDVRVVLLTGAGEKAFCAGLDVQVNPRNIACTEPDWLQDTKANQGLTSCPKQVASQGIMSDAHSGLDVARVCGCSTQVPISKNDACVLISPSRKQTPCAATFSNSKTASRPSSAARNVRKLFSPALIHLFLSITHGGLIPNSRHRAPPRHNLRAGDRHGAGSRHPSGGEFDALRSQRSRHRPRGRYRDAVTVAARWRTHELCQGHLFLGAGLWGPGSHGQRTREPGVGVEI